jgi:short-subunit dehydrogenase
MKEFCIKMEGELVLRLQEDNVDVHGKVVIVTGASSGIGEATAREFGRAGAKVVLAARRADRLEALAQEIQAMGTEALPVPMDLSRLEHIQALIDRTLEEFGRIDVLVNNAGIGRLGWLEELDPVEDIEAQFDINVLGLVHTTRQVLPVMMEQRSGHIINMGSMAGRIATPSYTIYAASKHAVHGFSEALRREVKPWGIDVSILYPGGVKTEFGKDTGFERKTKATTPRFLLLTAEEVGRAIVGLARRPRPMLIIPWLWRLPALLNRLFPSIVDYTTIHRFTIPERAEELKAGK